MQTPSILIVDDSPTTAKLIHLHLENMGYDVAGIARSATEALDIAAQTSPDLVLMDIYLGEGMDGIEAAEQLRGKHGIPVIYATSYSDKETLLRVKKTMPFGFINKPIRQRDLRTSIEIALNRRVEDHYMVRDIPISETPVLSEALDYLASGVILLNGDMDVFYTNKAADNILKRYRRLRITDNQLRCHNALLKMDLEDLVRKKSTRILSSQYNGNSFHLLVFPLTETQIQKNGKAPDSVLFLLESVNDPDRFEEVIRIIYKLSPTEARIASQLVVNPYLAEVASTLGITYNTARTHLKHIYYKTDTNKLPVLIQKIITGPAGLLMHATR